MNAGIEFLFWLLFFGFILLVWLLAEVVERKEKEVLPAPRMDCIARGGKDHWLVTVTTTTGERK